MSTTGTYSFNPGFSSLVLYAFNMAGLRNTSLLQEHFESARMAANMMMARWSSDGVNLWQVDLQTVPLVAGQATYTVPSTTVAMLDAYVTLDTGTAFTNRIMMPISRSEYASYPNPQEQGIPTVFWFDRLLSPTVTLWMVPNGQQASFSYYRLRQAQDTSMSSGLNVEIPQYFLEAFAYGLAFRLATIWNPQPQVAAGLKALADEAWAVATRQNEENANIYVTPQIATYFR